MLSLAKQLARTARVTNSSDVSELLRQAQHDIFILGSVGSFARPSLLAP